TITDTLSVRFNVKAYLPNVFSPNDDGENDTFIPGFSDASIQSYQMQIFDRWGDLAFSTGDPNTGWDGNRNGKACNPGVYVYFIAIETGACGKTILKGDVSIVR